MLFNLELSVVCSLHLIERNCMITFLCLLLRPIYMQLVFSMLTVLVKPFNHSIYTDVYFTVKITR